MSVRVRIAPSPTGMLHVGNARSAVFNWLFARHHGGTFIVRVDDTDIARSEEQYVTQMMEAMRWLGLDWDEGVGVGGPHGSYRQSDRFDRYREVAEQLIADGAAYRCFCTPEELDDRRQAAQAAGRPPGYDGACRTLGSEQVNTRMAAGESFLVRLAIPRPGVTEFFDLVRDDMRFDHDVIDDFVILRSDGTPTYHLASTVDDVDYEITHVARGEDLLSSTPRHILLTKAMGAEPVIYAHLPLLFGPDGKKLSKRHGDTSMDAYMKAGYLPEAMFNYMSLLGWSYDPEVTIYSPEQAIEKFDLADVSKNPAVFDTKKLEWMSGEYMRELAPDDFVARSLPFIEVNRKLSDDERRRFEVMAPLIQERVKVLPEVVEMSEWLFVDEVSFDEASWDKVMKPEAAPVLEDAIIRLEGLTVWSTEAIEGVMRQMLEDLELNPRKGFQPLRVAVTGSMISPPLFESMEVLGQPATVARLRRALARFV
ncbi:MAG: glutamate--tRNA ligase [Acidimicrobiia bacterium]|nr:glutamate--tRNA ligase [Acidimicrobiia bacterium]